MMRSDVTEDEDRDNKIAVVIRAALIVGDLATARELLGQMTSDDLIEQAVQTISSEEKRAAAEAGRPGPTELAPTFDELMSRHEFSAALQIAALPADYANLALKAAVAGDATTATMALARFEQESSGEWTVQNLGCELKRGFAHLLLEHEFDEAPLINDAEAWVEERSAELEMTAISFKWDISALKILSGGGQAVLEEPDVFGAGAAEKALAVGGVAAVALGIAGDRAWPYARNSMRLVIAGPTGPDTQRESDGPREDGPDRTPTRQLGQLSLAWRQSRAGERATPRRAIHVQADGRDLSGNPAVLERHTFGH
jgi:hypothetical protein